MAAKISVKRILTNNPRVDKKQFQEAMSALKHLRDSGIKDAQYDLKSPFRRHDGTQEQKRGHPRTVRLKS